MTKREQAKGKEGEALARKVLRSRGVLMVEKIGTPVRLVPIKGVRNGYRVYWGDKVSGDMTGILPNGVRVLAEVKVGAGDRISWTRLRAHQPERLDLNKEYNAVSLFVWVSDYGVFVLDWVYPNEDFGPGKNLRLDRARELDVMDIGGLK